MRGLPGCGKSHMARRLASGSGVVLETDEYFYTQVGADETSYDYSGELLPAARDWNLARFREAVRQNLSPIVIDRGNGLNPETKQYAVFAVENGDNVQLAEPDSPWWNELRVLLKYKQFVKDELHDLWAQKIAESTRNGHRVPSAAIRQWMPSWRYDLTIEEVLR